jgi:carbamoyl-phosphate synthase small subunit
MKAMLVLEDGTVFEGESFGAEGERDGEIVFNTSLTGYQEILTDPSYKGQIVTMTYPLIGNYGVNPADVESSGPQVEGFVVKEYCELPSNWRSRESLGDYLKRHGIVGIQGVDTRALTRHIRSEGAMKSVLSTTDPDPDSLVAKAKASPGLVGRDLVKEVTCKEPYHWTEGLYDVLKGEVESLRGAARFKVAAYDFGMKRNILRYLVDRGCDVTVFPADAAPEQLLEMDPDGIFLSNGPGDPEPITYAIENVRTLMHERPTFGICLGHELIGLALGGDIFKLKFGHRGANQPVKDLTTGKVEITSQNHGFAVGLESMERGSVELTHINLNDNTLEGLRHRDLPVFCVQYHPEASAGPHDAEYLFDEFAKLMESGR